MVMWHSDPDYLKIIADERWEREREAASLRRLVRGVGRPVSLPTVIWQVARILEQMYYHFSPGRFSAVPGEEDVASISDAEMARLLALLAPGAETLEVERVPRSRKPGEEPCLPGPCRERAS